MTFLKSAMQKIQFKKNSFYNEIFVEKKEVAKSYKIMLEKGIQRTTRLT